MTRWPHFHVRLGIILVMLSTASFARAAEDALPKGFVYLHDFAPSIVLELRYFSGDNFVGKRIDRYEAPRCILTLQAALALRSVQAELKQFGLGLKVFDAYRPQGAVDHFVRWAKDLQDTGTKETYYPNIAKKDLIGDYIAHKSGHSRGSSLDLTIVGPEGEELDMGSTFDFFDKKSWTLSDEITIPQRAHRMLLRTVMTKYGFNFYKFEWWHFTLKNEPFPETHFDFPVR